MFSGFVSRAFVRCVAGMMAAVVLSSPCAAHFVWVQIVDGRVKVVFGENASPENAALLGRLERLEGWAVRDGQAVPVTFSKETEDELGWLISRETGHSGAAEVVCEYGLFQRGEQTMWLHYGAKYWDTRQAMPAASGKLPLEILAASREGSLHLQATFGGEPLPGCSLFVVGPDGEQKELVGDVDGKASIAWSGGGIWTVRVGKAVPEAGQFEGREFSEKKYWCTLAVDSGKPLETLTGTAPAALPTGLTSFGAAVAGNRVFVFGGQMGSAHSYARTLQNGRVLSLDLDSPVEWKVVGESTGSQGLAVVACRDVVFRVGGFEARNEEGEDQNLHSLDTFARLDPETGSWTPLAPMPEPRSSFDACVIGDRLFVVGGWNMRGDQETVWSKTAFSIDLDDASAAAWKELPEPPFQRRAVAVGHLANRLYVIGGMEMDGEPSRKVNVFDLDSQAWSDGPELPENGRMEGFGSACTTVGDQLVVSTYGGSVYRLGADGKSWEKIHQLETSRFFHRMVPDGRGGVLLVGGANMESGHQLSTERIELGRE